MQFERFAICNTNTFHEQFICIHNFIIFESIDTYLQQHKSKTKLPTRVLRNFDVLFVTHFYSSISMF